MDLKINADSKFVVPEDYSHASSLARLLDDPLIEKDWLSPRELALRLGIEYHTVYYWCEQGWLDAERVDSVTGNSGRQYYHIKDTEVARISNFTHKHISRFERFAPRLIRQDRPIKDE